MNASSRDNDSHTIFAANIAGESPAETEGNTAPRLDLSVGTLNRALRTVAHEDLAVVRQRYNEHQDPVRCAVGISMVLRSLAEDIFGESRVCNYRGVSWLNFLVRTSAETLLRPGFIETMSAALYGDPADVELPADCGFWFDAAESWIDHQCYQRPVIACAVPFEFNV